MQFDKCQTISKISNFKKISVNKTDEFLKRFSSETKASLDSPRTTIISATDVVESGRYDYHIDDVVYETFYKSSATKRLFVFLSGAGRGGKTATNFNRVSWFEYFDGHCIAIEDPMYKAFPGIDVGWYYGTSDNCYLIEIADFVRQLAKIKDIDLKDVHFIGSSCAGYAAIFLADICHGSTSFSMNPQLIPASWDKKNSFFNNTNIDLHKVDKFKRNDITDRLLNSRSRHILFVNSLSTRDYREQISPVFKRIGISARWGCNTFGKTHIILAELKNPFPHGTFLEAMEMILIIDAFDKGCEDVLVPGMITILKQKFDYKYKLFFARSWCSIISQEIPECFILPDTASTPSTDVYMKGLNHNYLHRIFIDHTQNKCNCSLILMSAPPHVTSFVKEKISESKKQYDFNDNNGELVIKFRKPFPLNLVGSFLTKQSEDFKLLRSHFEV
ncbi:hypothetical protein CQ062_22415 [Ochrobactrum sp. MYb68]|nr:hypothetical protein CQ062_22415 [Ochrobactrum sp. MYb68]